MASWPTGATDDRVANWPTGATDDRAVLTGLAYSVGGLVVLGLASEQFVRGAARLAVIMRVAPIVVGAVIVGFGTSAPEMLVSGFAAADDRLDIGAGNVIGSNVANISLVLGVAALAAAVPVKRAVLRREAPLSVAAVAVFALLVQNGLNRFEAVALGLLLVAALAVIIIGSRTDPPGALDELIEDGPAAGRAVRPVTEVVRTVVSLGLVAGSAFVIVEGAERLADELGLSGGFVGYTLVAVGTSAPEIVTALVAARQGETELLVGNLLGSNIFNALAVGAVIGMVGPGPVMDPVLVTLGSALMVAICGVSWLAMAGGRVTRRKGALLVSLWLMSVIVLGSGEEVAAAGMGALAGG